MEHALSCARGGFPTICHNEIRDITAHLMSDVCHNVGIEPPLQQITSETMSYRTANVEEGARLDIKAQGFWGNDRQCAFFDVRVFNPFAHTYRSLPMATCYRRNEQKKEEPMINESERWNMDVFYHLSFPCLAAWAQLQRWCTRSSLP